MGEGKLSFRATPEQSLHDSIRNLAEFQIESVWAELPDLAWKNRGKVEFPWLWKIFQFLSAEFPFSNREFPFLEHRILGGL